MSHRWKKLTLQTVCNFTYFPCSASMQKYAAGDHLTCVWLQWCNKSKVKCFSKITDCSVRWRADTVIGIKFICITALFKSEVRIVFDQASDRESVKQGGNETNFKICHYDHYSNVLYVPGFPFSGWIKCLNIRYETHFWYLF